MSSNRPAPSTLGFPDHLDSHYPVANRDEAALVVLETLVEATDSPRPARVLERARGERPHRAVSVQDYQRTLELADGQLALVSWTSVYFVAIGYVGGDRPRYEAWAYSQLDEMQRGSENATTHESLFASDVRDELEERDPLVVVRNQTPLANGGENW